MIQLEVLGLLFGMYSRNRLSIKGKNPKSLFDNFSISSILFRTRFGLLMVESRNSEGVISKWAQMSGIELIECKIRPDVIDWVIALAMSWFQTDIRIYSFSCVIHLYVPG